MFSFPQSHPPFKFYTVHARHLKNAILINCLWNDLALHASLPIEPVRASCCRQVVLSLVPISRSYREILEVRNCLTSSNPTRRLCDIRLFDGKINQFFGKTVRRSCLYLEMLFIAVPSISNPFYFSLFLTLFSAGF